MKSILLAFFVVISTLSTAVVAAGYDCTSLNVNAAFPVSIRILSDNVAKLLIPYDGSELACQTIVNDSYKDVSCTGKLTPVSSDTDGGTVSLVLTIADDSASEIVGKGIIRNQRISKYLKGDNVIVCRRSGE